MRDTLYESSLLKVPLAARGKVRDIYAIGDDRLLIVATDRLSAFDVVLPDPIPGKGVVLTELTDFWFAFFSDHVTPQRVEGSPADVLCAEEWNRVEGRATLVERLEPLPVEAVVRGYLAGSGWSDYCARGRVSGVELPPGLRQAEALPEPIFTPSAKAMVGEHDWPLGFAEVQALIGPARAEQVRATALDLYRRAADYARERGIIIADTKFEFGVDRSGALRLIDEVLTPDSSRFWPADQHALDTSPPSFDKQYVRDYLAAIDWDKSPPGPCLPADVIENTGAKYREARDRLLRAPSASTTPSAPASSR